MQRFFSYMYHSRGNPFFYAETMVPSSSHLQTCYGKLNLQAGYRDQYVNMVGHWKCLIVSECILCMYNYVCSAEATCSRLNEKTLVPGVLETSDGL